MIGLNTYSLSMIGPACIQCRRTANAIRPVEQWNRPGKMFHTVSYVPFNAEPGRKTALSAPPPGLP